MGGVASSGFFVWVDHQMHILFFDHQPAEKFTANMLPNPYSICWEWNGEEIA